VFRAVSILHGTIRFLIIDTLTWWPGNKVLVAPQWIERVNWGDSEVLVNLPNEMPALDDSRHSQRLTKSRQHEFKSPALSKYASRPVSPKGGKSASPAMAKRVTMVPPLAIFTCGFATPHIRISQPANPICSVS